MFYYVEYNDLLGPVNEKHLFVLHYVFLPRINKAIEEFENAWNHHGVRTEREMTPDQLLTMGMLQLKNSGLTAMFFLTSLMTLMELRRMDSSPTKMMNGLKFHKTHFN